MKLLQKPSVAVMVMIAAIVAGAVLGQLRKPDTADQASTSVVGTYTYVYDHAHVLTDETMSYLDAMNTSLFAQTGAQIMVVTVDSTNGEDIIDYATDLGNTYGVGSRERNNGLVIVLALEDVAQNGLVGDYGISGGDGLYDYGQELSGMLYAYMEEDFAAGDYDAAVRKTFDAYIQWFSEFYGVTIRENYIPVTREHFSSGDHYYTDTSGYLPPTFDSVALQMILLVLCLLPIWIVLDGVRYSRYRRRYLVPGMGIPTVRYYPIFWGRPRRRRPPPPPRPPHPPRRPPDSGNQDDGSFGGSSFGGGFGGSRSSSGGGGSSGRGFGGSRGSSGSGSSSSRGSSGSRGSFGGGGSFGRGFGGSRGSSGSGSSSGSRSSFGGGSFGRSSSGSRGSFGGGGSFGRGFGGSRGGRSGGFGGSRGGGRSGGFGGRR